MEHDGINEENFLEKRYEWEPYLKKDILCLAGCVSKYNASMRQNSGFSMQGSVTSSSLTFKSWFAKTKESIHSHTDLYTRNLIRKAVKGGRVFANIQQYKSSMLDQIINILRENLNSDESLQELIGLYKTVNKELKSKINNQLSNFYMSEEIKILQTCFKTKEENYSSLIKKYNDLNKIQKKKIDLQIKNLPSKDVLISQDANSLYPSAMADKNSEFPKAESSRPIKQEEKKHFTNLFNQQNFRPRTGIFKVYYEYPTDLFLQNMPAKDSFILDDEKKTDLVRFRNGKIYDVLTSVDIQEIVRCGGRIICIFDGIVYDENFQESPFKKYVEELYNLRLCYKKEGNVVGSELIKLLLNSLYGKTVQKDIVTNYHLWNENTLRKNYTTDVKNFEEVQNDLYLVEINNSEDEFIDKNIINYRGKKCTSLMPSHLGAFILSHSKRIMNNYILAINGFKQPNVYYSDTDSIYIHNKHVKTMEEEGFIGNDLCQSKNDYGTSGIIFSLFLAPKVKYCIVINEFGQLEEKFTFKGLSDECSGEKNKDFNIKSFMDMQIGQTLKSKQNKPWKKSLEMGVMIPDKDDTIIKKFNANINIFKRQTPNENHIMYPYNDKLVSPDIIEKMKEENNLTNEDIKSNIFDVNYTIFE
jgi:hypothetical protein